jgi:uncharacterized protein (UPF0332 family)
MPQHEDYATAGREFLAKAQGALAQGDLAQASEKGWGASAQMVKALAERRGWEHRSHAELFRAVGRLVQETGDRRLQELFHAASSLHTNFYENWLPPGAVEIGLDQVEELVSKLGRLLEA